MPKIELIDLAADLLLCFKVTQFSNSIVPFGAAVTSEGEFSRGGRGRLGPNEGDRGKHRESGEERGAWLLRLIPRQRQFFFPPNLSSTS
jgi:hypothetical protein